MRQLIKQLIEETIASPEIQANLQEANKDNIVITEEYLRERLEQKTEDLQRLIADDWETMAEAEGTLGGDIRQLYMIRGVTGFVRVWRSSLFMYTAVTSFILLTFILSFTLPDSALVSVSNADLLSIYVNFRPYFTVLFLGLFIICILALVRRIRIFIRYTRRVRAQTLTDIETTKAQILQLNEKVRTSLLEEGILPELRMLINDHIDPSYERYLNLRTAPDLVEMINASFQIPTEANNKVLRLLRNMRGGSLGIAGSRGAGKTTLIWSFCNPSGVKIDDQPILSVMISAPVEYNAREFILYLFMSICHKVLQLKQKTSPTGSSLVDEIQSSGIRSQFQQLGVAVYQSKFTKVAFAFAVLFGVLAAISSVPPTSEGDFTKVLKNLGLTGELLGTLCLAAAAIGGCAWMFGRIGRNLLKHQRTEKIFGTQNWRVDSNPYQSTSRRNRPFNCRGSTTMDT